MQIFSCLSALLTEAGKNRVFLEAHKYALNGIVDGLLFLKVVIQLAHINTRVTFTVIRSRLSSLNSKMVYLQDDITQFNEFVKMQRVSLEARGERTLDLLVNLFKGYKAAADNRFVLYIKGKEDNNIEGNDITPDALMELAESKYKILVKNNLWKQPLAADHQIVALTAYTQQMELGKPEKEAAKHQQNNERKKFPDNGDAKWFLVLPKKGEQPKK
jgi:hypothetical protein